MLLPLPVTHILQELTLKFEAQVIECENDCVARIAETEQRCVFQVRGSTAHRGRTVISTDCQGSIRCSALLHTVPPMASLRGS